LDDQQKELIRKEVEIAILKERMEQQEVRMQQELKLLNWLPFEVKSIICGRNRKRAMVVVSGTSDDGGSGNAGKTKEIHIQELHVQVGSNLPTKADGTVDPQYIQAATQAATTAALENAMKQYEMDQRAHHREEPTTATTETTATAAAADATIVVTTIAAAKAKATKSTHGIHDDDHHCDCDCHYIYNGIR
jgi:hypothetical protein